MRSTADDLSTCLDELLALSDETATGRVTSLAQRLVAGDLRVALVGEAKRGKSTFGNAVLGRDVLPSTCW